MDSNLQPYSKEWLEKLCKESISYAEVLRKAGRSTKGGGSYNTLKDKIKEFEIDTSHFLGQAWSKGKKKETDERVTRKGKWQIEEIFIKDSPVTRNVIKDYVVKYSLLDYKCEFCGNEGSWLNVIVSLELDHKNGINNDNRIENLRWLCPNCHATTNTYCGKNIPKKDRSTETQKKTTKTWDRICLYCGTQFLGTKEQKYCSQECVHKSQIKVSSENYDISNREELKQLIREKSFTEVGRIFGVSDNTIRKHCKKHNLPYRKSDINNYDKESWEYV